MLRCRRIEVVADLVRLDPVIPGVIDAAGTAYRALRCVPGKHRRLHSICSAGGLTWSPHASPTATESSEPRLRKGRLGGRDGCLWLSVSSPVRRPAGTPPSVRRGRNSMP